MVFHISIHSEFRKRSIKINEVIKISFSLIFVPPLSSVCHVGCQNVRIETSVLICYWIFNGQ